jgi:hypothetical protein
VCVCVLVRECRRSVKRGVVGCVYSSWKAQEEKSRWGRRREPRGPRSEKRKKRKIEKRNAKIHFSLLFSLLPQRHLLLSTFLFFSHSFLSPQTTKRRTSDVAMTSAKDKLFHFFLLFDSFLFLTTLPSRIPKENK